MDINPPNQQPHQKHKAGSMYAWILAPFFMFAGAMMSADFVAIETRKLQYLAGQRPLWIVYMPLLCPVGTITIWILLRRRIGNWGLLLGYILCLQGLVMLANHTMNAQLDRIDTRRMLTSDETTLLEKELGFNIYPTQSSSSPPHVFFLRDTLHHEQIKSWLVRHDL